MRVPVAIAIESFCIVLVLYKDVNEAKLCYNIPCGVNTIELCTF